MALATEQSLPFSTPWRALQIFSTYRLILALAMLGVFMFSPQASFLGDENPQLYYVCALSFLLFAATSLLLSFTLNRFYYLQLEVQVLLDITLIILLMHASGGITSGLGVLIAVSTSAASILTGNPAALGFSVLASFGILGEEIYANLVNSHVRDGMTQVGILSVTFMATSLMSFYLSR